MWALKSNILYPVFVFFVVSSSVGYSVDAGDEEFSRRMCVHEALDGCIDIIYQIKCGEVSQNEGLDQLEETLDMVQFMTWYWIED